MEGKSKLMQMLLGIFLKDFAVKNGAWSLGWCDIMTSGFPKPSNGFFSIQKGTVFGQISFRKSRVDGLDGFPETKSGYLQKICQTKRKSPKLELIFFCATTISWCHPWFSPCQLEKILIRPLNWTKQSAKEDFCFNNHCWFGSEIRRENHRGCS